MPPPVRNGERRAQTFRAASQIRHTRASPLNTPAEEVNSPSTLLDPIFPQIVGQADDPQQKLIGFIAYGLFVEAKREWASDFQSREGRYPSQAEIRSYEGSWTLSRLDGIRNAAVQVVAAYADTIGSQIESDVLRATLKGHFWRNVGRWLFSALLFSLMLVGAYVTLGRVGIDPFEAILQLAAPPMADPT